MDQNLTLEHQARPQLDEVIDAQQINHLSDVVLEEGQLRRRGRALEDECLAGEGMTGPVQDGDVRYD